MELKSSSGASTSGSGVCAVTPYNFTQEGLKDSLFHLTGDALPLISNEGQLATLLPLLPQLSQPAERQTFRAIKTCGDGGCGVHAVFGKPCPLHQNELFLPHARTFVVQTLGPEPQALSRRAPRASQCIMTVRASLWAELTLPYLRKVPSTESDLFVDAMLNGAGALARNRDCCWQYEKCSGN